MKSFYLTDTGKIRSHNEDSVTIVKNSSNEMLMIVADGMGGHRAGEVASSMVVTHMGARFSELSTIGTKLDAVNWLKENVDEINNKINNRNHNKLKNNNHSKFIKFNKNFNKYKM